MEAKTIIKLATMSVVAVALIGAFLIPTITDSADPKPTTLSDNGKLYYMKDIPADSSDSLTISWSNANSRVLNINGTDFNPYSTYGNKNSILVLTNDWELNFAPSDGILTYVNFADNINRNGKTMSFNASNGSATIIVGEFDDTTTEYTATYSTMRVIDLDATDMMMSRTPYIKEDTEVISVIDTGLTGGHNLITFTGSIKNGFTSTVKSTDGDRTVTNVAVDYELTEYPDVYKINKITSTLTKTSTGTAKSITNLDFIVPSAITYDAPAPLDSSADMLHIIPFFMVVGMVLACIGAILMRRRD